VASAAAMMNASATLLSIEKARRLLGYEPKHSGRSEHSQLERLELRRRARHRRRLPSWQD